MKNQFPHAYNFLVKLHKSAASNVIPFDNFKLMHKSSWLYRRNESTMPWACHACLIMWLFFLTWQKCKRNLCSTTSGDRVIKKSKPRKVFICVKILHITSIAFKYWNSRKWDFFKQEIQCISNWVCRHAIFNLLLNQTFIKIY